MKCSIIWILLAATQHDGTADALDELAFQAKSGDRQALTDLLTHPEIRRPVLAIACQMVGSAEAEDVYQDVCVCLVEALYLARNRKSDELDSQNYGASLL